MLRDHVTPLNMLQIHLSSTPHFERIKKKKKKRMRRDEYNRKRSGRVAKDGLFKKKKKTEAPIPLCALPREYQTVER